MAFTEIYVDPSINADSGAGTVGDPYGDLEYAIEQETFDTTNGTRINIKAGATETLAANLSDALADTSVSIAWAPSGAAPLVFQGYTATAGDGGIGVISGGATVPIYSNSSLDGIHFRDLDLGNCGAQPILTVDDDCYVVGCEVHNTTGVAINVGERGFIVGNYIYDVGNKAIVGFVDGGFVGYNYIDGVVGTEVLTDAVDVGIQVTAGYTVYRNIIKVQGAADGILSVSAGNVINGNSIYSSAGTGFGIDCKETTTKINYAIMNNLIEGFSGVGGVGINIQTENQLFIAGNSVYDCTTAISSAAGTTIFSSGNETLGASPFTAAASGDFSPVDTGSVKEGVIPAIIGGGLV